MAILRLISVTPRTKDRALIALCGFCGLRSHEAVGVIREHLDLARRELTVSGGKGAKDRMVPISDMAFPYLVLAWLSTLPGAYVVPKSDEGEQMTPDGARAIIRRLGAKAGLEVSSHDLRATFATEVYGATKDVLTVQRLLGHANVTTTQGYVERTEVQLRSAVNAWSPS